MKKYTDFKQGKTKNSNDLTSEELKKVEWAKYKIVVPTEEDRQEIMDALEHFHNEGYDSDIIAANQLAHEYLTDERQPGSRNNIIVDSELYDKIKDRFGK